MSQSLFLTCDDKSIGVVRNPYERVVTEYFYSFNYIGFDNWVTEFTPPPQVELYKDCDYIVNYSDWQQAVSYTHLRAHET